MEETTYWKAKFRNPDFTYEMYFYPPKTREEVASLARSGEALIVWAASTTDSGATNFDYFDMEQE
jgi:hypothetical protein